MFEWEAYDKEQKERGAEWYVATILIAVAIIAIAIILDNILLAVIIGTGFVVLLISYTKKPEKIRYALSEKGVRIHDHQYPFSSLESYFLDEEGDRLVLKPRHMFAQHLYIPLPNGINLEELDDILAERLDEEEMRENIFEQFMNYLGF